MEPSRRDLMGVLAAASAVLPIAAHAASRMQPTDPAIFPPPPGKIELLRPDGRMTVNRERAYHLMKAAGVDAIIGGGNANSRYLTNMRSVISEMGIPRRIVGIMPADPRKPIIAVMPSVDIARHSAPDREWPEIITYSSPTDADRYKNMAQFPPGDLPQAMPARAWAHSTSGPLTAVEQGWLHDEARPQAMAATLELGVAKALDELGLTRAKVAVDDDTLAAGMVRSGLESVRIVPGENLFLRIRQIKSAVEIDRMRVVTRLNDGASRAMMGQLHPGMTFEDIQAIFFSEVTRRGGRPEFMVAGMTSGLRSGRLVKHEPFLVDCCGNFDGYSGDFARTVVLGTPPQLLIDRARLLERVAVEITAFLKPGVRYSQIVQFGRELSTKLGVTFPIGYGPHSVGLAHSDDPNRDDLPFEAREDVMLQPGMVITVDLPTLEPGWGSMHLESLILITEHGAEWLDRFDDPLYEVNV